MCISRIPRVWHACVDHSAAMRDARRFCSESMVVRGGWRALAGTGRLLLATVLLSATGPTIEAATATPTPVWPTLGWETAKPADLGMDTTQLQKARDYAMTGAGSGVITRYGISVMTWGSQSQLYDLKSATKSIGVTALGVAIGDNLVALQDKARLHLFDLGAPPSSNELKGWPDEISVLQLATHSAGFDKPGGFIDLLYRPGTMWSYSDGGANWLADVLTVISADDLKSVMFSRVFAYLGITTADLTWRNNQYRGDTINGIKRREFGAGIKADVDAMARIGYLYLRRGSWDGVQLVPGSFVDQVSRPASSISALGVRLPASFPNAQKHYGLLWWNNGDGTLANVPKDTYWAWGLYDSLIVVIPSLDIVAARAGNGWRSGWDANYAVAGPFIEPIVKSVTATASGGSGDGSLLTFDGNDDMVRVPNSASLSPSSAISVEAWIRPRTIANSK
jgi:CubicO group peptidase (beta-lactamase class C family)